MDTILFLLFTFMAVACAINLVLQRHPISSALSLIGVMFALAALYLLAGGEFIAMGQLIVYAGAIMVLFVFVIMLLNAGAEMKRQRRLWVKYAGPLLMAGLLAVVAYIVNKSAAGGEQGVNFGVFQHGGAEEIGLKLFQSYLLPFEITSVLVLIAIVGAIVLARKEVQ